jgi:hypothetical protein
MPYRSGWHYQARPAESRLAIVASDSGGGRQFSGTADLETKEWSRRTFQVRNALPAQNASHYHPLLPKNIQQSSRGHETS